MDITGAHTCLSISLWYKLYADISGECLLIILSIYLRLKSRDKQCKSHSEYIKFSVGLRQRKIVSPLHVSLFQKD